MEIPKKGILIAYVSNHRKWFGMGFPKKEILMDYISKSCDLQKMKIAGGFVLIQAGHVIYQKRKFLMVYISILREHFLKNYQK